MIVVAHVCGRGNISHVLCFVIFVLFAVSQTDEFGSTEGWFSSCDSVLDQVNIQG